jgi:hypothetical protein
MTDVLRTYMEPTTAAYTNTDAQRHAARLALASAWNRTNRSIEDLTVALAAAGLDRP